MNIQSTPSSRVVEPSGLPLLGAISPRPVEDGTSNDTCLCASPDAGLAQAKALRKVARSSPTGNNLPAVLASLYPLGRTVVTAQSPKGAPFEATVVHTPGSLNFTLDGRNSLSIDATGNPGTVLVTLPGATRQQAQIKADDTGTIHVTASRGGAAVEISQDPSNYTLILGFKSTSHAGEVFYTLAQPGAEAAAR